MKEKSTIDLNFQKNNLQQQYNSVLDKDLGNLIYEKLFSNN